MKIGKKNKDEPRRGTAGEYKRQQSYHYSAKRSNADRLYGRKEYDENEKSETDRLLLAQRRLRLLPSILAGILIIAGALYVLHVSPSVSIETDANTGFIGDKSAVQAKADDYMKSSIMNRTKLTFKEQDLQTLLQNQFPEFSSIEVNTYIFRQKPVVHITFAKPTLLLTDGSRVYIVSESGTVLADITKKKPEIDTSKLLLVKDDTGVAIELGKVALTSEQVSYIQQITFQTDKKGLRTESMILVPGGGELRVKYAGQGYYVKYNLFEDARKSSGTFLAAKDDLTRRGVTPTEYLDVRIPERAYVK